MASAQSVMSRDPQRVQRLQAAGGLAQDAHDVGRQLAFRGAQRDEPRGRRPEVGEDVDIAHRVACHLGCLVLVVVLVVVRRVVVIVVELGDVPIGAVVLDATGAVIASARNEREVVADPTAHAEVLALRAAAAAVGDGWRLDGCTLVVTLEPCTMCAGASVLARVGHVVYGADDPKAGAVGSLWDVVRDRRLNHRPEVVAGVLADESTDLLDGFFRTHRAL